MATDLETALRNQFQQQFDEAVGILWQAAVSLGRSYDYGTCDFTPGLGGRLGKAAINVRRVLWDWRIFNLPTPGIPVNLVRLVHLALGYAAYEDGQVPKGIAAGLLQECESLAAGCCN